MEHRKPTLLQLINRHFALTMAEQEQFENHGLIARSLGMSDQELAEAERRGFSDQEAQMITSAVSQLGFRLRNSPGQAA